MCVLRQILGRHLTDLGVCASRLRGFVSPLSLLLCTDTHASQSRVGRVLAGKLAAGGLSRTKTPPRGKFNFFINALHPGQVTGRTQVYEEPMWVCIMRLRWVYYRAASWREGCICTWFWHAPILTQPSHRNPGSAMSTELSVGTVND